VAHLVRRRERLWLGSAIAVFLFLLVLPILLLNIRRFRREA
jgi:ABC-type sugar transport system permease subunit